MCGWNENEGRGNKVCGKKECGTCIGMGIGCDYVGRSELHLSV